MDTHFFRMVLVGAMRLTCKQIVICVVQEFSWLTDVFNFVSQNLCPVLPESTVDRESPNHFLTWGNFV